MAGFPHQLLFDATARREPGWIDGQTDIKTGFIKSNRISQPKNYPYCT